MESLPKNPKQSDILVYSRDHCPYCDAVKNLFTQKGVAYSEVNISNEPDKLDEMLKKAAPRRTFPQVFIGDQGLGGFDDVKALDSEGKLEAILFPNGR